MKVGIITTLGHNIGDDFVRIGIVRLLNGLNLKDTVECVLVNKHDPLTIYGPSHPLRWISSVSKYLPRGRRKIEGTAERYLHRLGGSRFADCDVVVQSGAPVLFDGCSTAEWAGPIWDRVVRPMARGKVVLNLAAGSCYPWTSQPAAIKSVSDADFLRRIFSYCKVMTVRDRLAEKLMDGLGIQCLRLPCTALLAAPSTGRTGPTSGPIYVNYMKFGGHYTFGQKISGEAWLETLRNLMRRLSRRHDVRMLCHSPGELDLALSSFPEYQAVLPKSADEYFDLISSARGGIFNRLHAAVALAGMGMASIGVGTDTRMLMLEQIGIPYRFVGDANAEELEQATETILGQAKSESSRLAEIRASAWQSYLGLLGPALAGCRER